MIPNKILKNIADSFSTTGETIFEGNRNHLKIFKYENIIINVKFFKNPNFLKKIIYKYFRESKAKRSFENANFLIANGFLTPKPFGFIENFDFLGLTDSYYFCEHLERYFTLGSVVNDLNYLDREKIITDYTTYFYNLHCKGIEFIDNSLGNTLIINRDNQYFFYLVDLNRLNKNKKFTEEDCMKNFARLTFNHTVWEIISKQYSILNNTYTQENLYNKLQTYTLNFYEGVAIKRNLKKFRFFDLKNLDSLNN